VVRVTTADARRGIALAGDQLTTLNLAETVYWTGSLAKRANPVSANLLPAYDEYNVAYKHRELVSNVLGPTVIVNGVIAGTWRATAQQGFVLIHVTSSPTLKESEKLAVAKAADRYGSYLETPARVAYGLR
jgi:hypothetical protein